MKRFGLTVSFFTGLILSHGVFLHAEETPPYEVKDFNVSENFRRIYYDVDRLSLVTYPISFTSSTNLLCIDSPTFCVDGLNNKVSALYGMSAGSMTITSFGSGVVQSNSSGVLFISGSLPPDSTNYIQNTGSPTISTQTFSVQHGTVTANFNVKGSVGINVTSGITRTRFDARENASKAVMSVENDSTTGWSAFDMYDSGGNQVGGFGYGNSAVGNFPSQMYMFSFSGDMVFAVNGSAPPKLGIILKGSGLVGVNNTSPAAQLDVGSPGATTVPIIARGYASQSANLMEARNSSGVIFTTVAANGDISAPSVTVTTVTTNNVNSTYISGIRNMMINGDMRIDQRWAGTTSTTTSTGVTFVMDQWSQSGQTSDGSFTLQRISTTNITGFTHCAQMVVTSSDGAIGATQRYYFRQDLEGSSVKHLNWGAINGSSCTLSFYVFSSTAGPEGVVFGNSAGNRSYAASYTINTANTWEKKTLVIPPDVAGTWAISDNTVGIAIYFSLGSGSSRVIVPGSWQGTLATAVSGHHPIISVMGSTFCVTGVQFEVGQTASAYEYTPDYEMLFRCKRFYQKSFTLPTFPQQASLTVNGTASYFAHVAGIDNDGIRVEFPVTMCTNPTMTGYNPSSSNNKWRNETAGTDSGSPTFSNISDTSFVVLNPQVAVTDALGSLLSIHWQAEAGL